MTRYLGSVCTDSRLAPGRKFARRDRRLFLCRSRDGSGVRHGCRTADGENAGTLSPPVWGCTSDSGAPAGRKTLCRRDVFQHACDGQEDDIDRRS
jgi:hypothetical protein